MFIHASTESLYAKLIMEKMPDLWSFRSLMLDIIDIQDNQATKVINPPLTGGDQREFAGLETTLSGTDKPTELARLLGLLKETPEDEIAFRLTLYPQIAVLQTELGRYYESLVDLKRLGTIRKQSRPS